MRIGYFHASVYGNGAMVAEEFKRIMSSKGIEVEIHHVEKVKPEQLPPADLYIFSSPGRFGKPIKEMRRFLKDVDLPKGTRFAVLTTEPAPQPDKKTGKMPSEEELGACQHVLPIMNDLLQEKGYVKVGEAKVFVKGLKGPLAEGWQQRVEAFANTIATSVPH